MNELKYVIVKQVGMNDKGKRAIVFNGAINHSSMLPRGFKACSAGFCSLQEDGSVKAYGKSDSLNLSSDDDDGSVIYSTLHKLLPTFGIWESKHQ